MSYHEWGGPADPAAKDRYWGIKATDWEQYTHWNHLPEALKANHIRIAYIGVDGSYWELAGPRAGYEGVVLEKEFLGPLGVPFEHKWTEGPYLIGSIRERTDYRKRPMSFGVVINPNSNIRAKYNIPSELVYFDTEARWQRAWSKEVHGWLGAWTRATGWRWFKVILDGGSQQTVGMDPTAFGNNMRRANVNIVSGDPYAYRTAFVSEPVGFDPDQPLVEVLHQGSTFKPLDWLLHPDGEPQMVHQSHVRGVNRGQIEAWPKYLVTGPGQTWIQDGVSDVMVPCPKLYASDGFMMVDTDPEARTFTTSKEPVDNVFYRFARQVEILEYFPGLADLGDNGLPAWRRANGARFATPIPRETEFTTRLYTDNPNTKVTVLVPQRYENAW